jgi:hypothetical protein
MMLRDLALHYARLVRAIWRDWTNPQPRMHWYE